MAKKKAMGKEMTDILGSQNEPNIPGVNKVEMRIVESSHISSIGYDGKERTLFIKFKSNHTWKYHPVTADGYREMLRSDSVGSYFHKNIKNNSTLKAEEVKP